MPYPEDGRPFGDGSFPTASGKVELYSDALAAMGQPALPTFVAPRESLAGDPSEHSYALLTPKQHTRFLNSGYSHLPRHGRGGRAVVEMTADDAAALGVPDGTGCACGTSAVRCASRPSQRSPAQPRGRDPVRLVG